MLQVERLSVELTDPLSGVSTRSLAGVSFAVGRGEAVALLGPNGAGKSTLLFALAGLANRATGEVRLDGRPLREAVRKAPAWFLSRVGVAFQFPERGFFQPTVYGEVSFTSRMLGRSEEEVEAAVERGLSLVGLDRDFGGRSPFSLSGGEKRRVALAAAVAHGPSLLLLDEPEVGLDWNGRRAVHALIRAHADQGGAAIVATHRPADALGWADRFLILEDGRVAADLEADRRRGAPPEAIARRLPDGGALQALREGLEARGMRLPSPYVDPAGFAAGLEGWLRGNTT